MDDITQAVIVPLALFFIFAVLAVAVCMRAHAISRGQFAARLVILCVYAVLVGYFFHITN